MSDDDYVVLQRILEDKGVIVTSVDKHTGIIQLCGPCSASLPCPRHSGSRHRPARPW